MNIDTSLYIKLYTGIYKYLISQKENYKLSLKKY